jgi:hypothetical protein
MKPTPCPEWNPRMTYTWERKQLKAWLLHHGAKAFCGGYEWAIKHKHLGVGVYDIRFIRLG